MTTQEDILKQFDEEFGVLRELVCPIHYGQNIQTSDSGEPSEWFDFCEICAEESGRNEDKQPELIPSETAVKAFLLKVLIAQDEKWLLWFSNELAKSNERWERTLKAKDAEFVKSLERLKMTEKSGPFIPAGAKFYILKGFAQAVSEQNLRIEAERKLYENL